jgi:hypothetical protein
VRYQLVLYLNSSSTHLISSDWLTWFVWMMILSVRSIMFF